MPASIKWLKVIIVVVLAHYTGSPAFCEAPYPETPEELVQAFCTAYSQGAGLSSDTAESAYKYTTWLDTPGWDRAQIIRKYELTRERSPSSHAQVKVRFQIVGYLESGEKHWQLNLVSSEEDVMFTTRKIGGQWRITKPLIPPHISAATAIRFLESEVPSLPKNELAKRQMQIQSLREVTSRE